jgi:hypothetical protein
LSPTPRARSPTVNQLYFLCCLAAFAAEPNSATFKGRPNKFLFLSFHSTRDPFVKRNLASK